MSEDWEQVTPFLQEMQHCTDNDYFNTQEVNWIMNSWWNNYCTIYSDPIEFFFIYRFNKYSTDEMKNVQNIRLKEILRFYDEWYHLKKFICISKYNLISRNFQIKVSIAYVYLIIEDNIGVECCKFRKMILMKLFIYFKQLKRSTRNLSYSKSPQCIALEQGF